MEVLGWGRTGEGAILMGGGVGNIDDILGRVSELFYQSS